VHSFNRRILNSNSMSKAFALLFAMGLGIVCGCNTPEPVQKSSLLSDGYVAFSINGNSYHILDSLVQGNPVSALLSGSYGTHDSTLVIGAYAEAELRIEIRDCTDTGLYALSSSDESYATVYDEGEWSTDEDYQGEVHLTELDTVQAVASGTFSFDAVTTKHSEPDTVHVFGKFYHAPIPVSRGK
jgi:hypothetical protein